MGGQYRLLMGRRCADDTDQFCGLWFSIIDGLDPVTAECNVKAVPEDPVIADNNLEHGIVLFDHQWSGIVSGVSSVQRLLCQFLWNCGAGSVPAVYCKQRDQYVDGVGEG